MNKKQQTKAPYVKPKMVIEKVNLATVAGQYGASPVPQLMPFFGLCPPCN